MEVDTGASLSLISEETYRANFSSCFLQSTEVRLKTYSGEYITVLGSINVEVTYNHQRATLPLLVVKVSQPLVS